MKNMVNARQTAQERTRLLDRAARKVERRVLLTNDESARANGVVVVAVPRGEGRPQTKRREGDCFEVETEAHATPRKGCVLVLGIHLVSVLSVARGDDGKRTRRCGWGYRVVI